MKHYIEVTLIENSDFSGYQLWSKLYEQLHLAFVEQKSIDDKIDFGVSFPEYQFNEHKKMGFLGHKLRVFAKTQAALEALDLTKWFERLLDYVHLTSIRAVPKHVDQFVAFRRVQKKGEKRMESLLQHKIEHYAMLNHQTKQDVSAQVQRLFEGETEHISPQLHDFFKPYLQYKKIDLPFIEMKSLTSQTRFKLFIAKMEATQQGIDQKFTTYGLNNIVPEF